MDPTFTTVACTLAPAALMALARASSEVPLGVTVKGLPLTVRVKLDDELMLPVAGSVTTGEPAPLMVVVDDPILVT